MSDNFVYLTYFAALVLAMHGGYSGKIVETCRTVGKELEGATGPNGFQDAITPPETTRGLKLNWGATFVLLILTWWMFGVGGLFAVLAIRVVARVVVGAVLSGKAWSDSFVRSIFTSMCRRHADYVKSGDIMRAEAMDDLVKRFERSEFV